MPYNYQKPLKFCPHGILPLSQYLRCYQITVPIPRYWLLLGTLPNAALSHLGNESMDDSLSLSNSIFQINKNIFNSQSPSNEIHSWHDVNHTCQSSQSFCYRKIEERGIKQIQVIVTLTYTVFCHFQSIFLFPFLKHASLWNCNILQCPYTFTLSASALAISLRNPGFFYWRSIETQMYVGLSCLKKYIYF